MLRQEIRAEQIAILIARDDASALHCLHRVRGQDNGGRATTGTSALSVRGLTWAGAEDLLDWLEAHGSRGKVDYQAGEGFRVRCRWPSRRDDEASSGGPEQTGRQ